jgi:ABC-type Zn uptake system ZnuABC Zn-binding protein ZnuA
MGDVIELAGSDATIVDLGARVPIRAHGDPHWWHDPRNAEAAVAAIRDAMAKANPGARAVYTRNADVYLARLRALDRGIAACIGRVPKDARKLVTDHDAFGYFARRYGITVVGAVIPSQTTQAQPSAGDIAKLTRQIRDEHVKAVFPESSLNAKLAQAIARQTGAVSDLTLYGDTLGPKGSRGATYLTMEQANADAMVRGFTGGAQRCAIAGL